MYDSDTKEGHRKQLVVIGTTAAAAIASHVPLSFSVEEHIDWIAHVSKLVKGGMFTSTYQMTLESFEQLTN